MSNERAIRLVAIANFGLEGGTRARIAGGNAVDVLMSEYQPLAEGSVADHLQRSERRDLRARLVITTLEGFAPTEILSRLDAAQPWLAARSALRALTEEATAVDVVAALPASLRDEGFGQRWQRSSGVGVSAVDSLLRRVDGEPAPRDAALDEIDRRLGRQVAAIIAQPWFAEVEAAWRGLAFLLGRVSPTVEVEILSAPASDAASSFFETVFQGEYEGDDDQRPLTSILLGHELGRTRADFERAEAFARMGESLRVPVLGGVGADFLGLKRLALLGGLPGIDQRLAGSEYVHWNRLRAQEASLWLGLTVNRFLLRPRWGDDSADAWPPLHDDEPPLWGHGAWALATVVARAWGGTGAGRALHEIDLDGLPTEVRGRAQQAHASAVSLGDARVVELSQCGLIPLASRPDEDAIRFPVTVTFHRPKRYTDDRATMASLFAATLSHQIFAALASFRLQRVAEALELGLDDQALREAFVTQLETFLVEVLGRPDHEETTECPTSVVVEIETPPDQPAVRAVTARLRPAGGLAGGPVDLVLGTAVLVQ